MGIARKDAAAMSKQMVTLGADMASFNNASPEETLDAIRAGLAGETEPLRRFGVFLNEARIAQQALSMGLVKGGEALARAQTATKTATAAVAAATKERTAAAQALDGGEQPGRAGGEGRRGGGGGGRDRAGQGQRVDGEAGGHEGQAAVGERAATGGAALAP